MKFRSLRADRGNCQVGLQPVAERLVLAIPVMAGGVVIRLAVTLPVIPVIVQKGQEQGAGNDDESADISNPHPERPKMNRGLRRPYDRFCDVCLRAAFLFGASPMSDAPPPIGRLPGNPVQKREGRPYQRGLQETGKRGI